MTLYQAKGLEFPVVVVPNLLEGEWPTKEMGSGWFPRELLREQVPGGNLHTDEERRLLYVAMTRAQDRLLLSTHAGAAAKKGQSVFIGELLEEHGAELVVIDRTVAEAEADAVTDAGDAADGLDDADEDDDAEARATSAALAAARRVMPLPTARERRLVLRLRAAELVGLHGGHGSHGSRSRRCPGRLRGAAPRDRPGCRHVRRRGSSGGLGPAHLPHRRAGHRRRGQPPARRPRPVRVLVHQPQHLRPSARSSSPCGTSTRSRGRTRPRRSSPSATPRTRRSRSSRGCVGSGSPAVRHRPPARSSGRCSRPSWTAVDFGDVAAEAGYKRRAEGLLDNFWKAELAHGGGGPPRGARLRACPGAR